MENIGIDECTLAVLLLRSPYGKTTWFSVEMGKDVEGNRLSIPVAVVRGRADGPVAYLGGGAHADELGSVEIVSRVVEGLDGAALAWTVVAVPIQDPLATRFSWWSATRLNRDSGTRNGNGGLVHAMLGNIARGCGGVIDVHAPSAFNVYLPTAYIKGNLSATASIALAKAMETRFVVVTSANKGDDLIWSVVADDVGGVMYEAGEGGRKSPRELEAAVSSIMKGLSHIGVMGGDPVTPPSVSAPVLVENLVPVVSDWPGFPEYTVALGDPVNKGRPVAVVRDVFGALRTVLAPCDGWVISTCTRSYLEARDRIALLGQEGVR